MRVIKMYNQRIDFKAGFSCNNYCRFCVQGNKRKNISDLTTEEAKEKLLQAKEKSDKIVFTGGEVTIRKDVIDLVSFAKQIGFSLIQIQTNGRMLADKNFCQTLIEAGVTEFSPAIHGDNALVHDYLTRSSGSFNQTIKGIINLKKLNQKIITNTVITRSNFERLPSIASLLVKLEVDQFQFAFVHPLGNAFDDFYSIVPSLSLIMPWVKEGLDIGIKAKIPVYTEAIPLCFMKGYENCVAEEIIPETKIFEINNIIESYTKIRIDEGKVRGKPCEKCVQKCEGPWKEYPQKYGWDEFIPIKKGKVKEEANYLGIKKAEKSYSILDNTLHYILKTECKNNCIFCTTKNLHKDKKWFEIDKKEEVINKLKKLNKSKKYRLHFAAIEPLEHPDIVEIVTNAAKIGFCKIDISTSGRALSDVKFASQVVQFINCFQIPLFGHNDRIHDPVAQNDGAFFQTWKGIKNAYDYGAKNIKVHLVVVRQNQNSIFQFAENILKNQFIEFNKIIIARPNEVPLKESVSFTADIYELQNYLKFYKEKNHPLWSFIINKLTGSIPPCAIHLKYEEINAIYSKVNRENIDIKPTKIGSIEKQLVPCIYIENCKLSCFCPGVPENYFDYYKQPLD